MQRFVARCNRFVRRCARGFVRSLERHPYIWLSIGAVTIIVLALQLAYPSGRALPLARLDGERVSGQSQTSITKTLQRDYATVPLTLQIGTTQYKTTAAEAGLKIDEPAVVRGLTDYPWWQRLIPLSLLVVGATKNQAVQTSIDEARFNDYAEARSKDCAVAAKDAGVVVRGETVKLDPAKDGQACPVAYIRTVFDAVSLQKGGTVARLDPQTVKPDRSDKEVASVLKQAQAIVDRQLTITMADKKVSVSKSEVASWLTFPQADKTKNISVAIDEAKVKTYLASAQSVVYVAPGTTHIATLDGVETGRSVGANGRGVDTGATATAISKQLLQGEATTSVQATLITLPPKVVYDRSYSPTQAGLQALLSDIIKDKGDYAISVRTLSGVSASVNASKHYHPASTYKMYVGWAIIQRIAAGQMKWEDAAMNGKNVSQCFDAMIINSDNACGEWLGTQIGWSNLNTMLRGIGLSCTNLSSAWYSCASDETLFLYKLQTGQIMAADQADRLLSVMKRQVYRSGIPAGTGVSVADKVGFLNGLLHDAAIVYAPHGTYVLTIMTSGSSWGQIADAARQIQAQLNRMSG